MGKKRKTVEALDRAESLEAALGDPSKLARAAVAKGKALLAPLMRQLNETVPTVLTEASFREPMRLFSLALRIDPENAEASAEIEKLRGEVFEVLPRDVVPPNHPDPFDVVVVGGGASGVGIALMLTRTYALDPERVLIVERGEGVGETFRRWPREMRFISPSFNSQGWTGSFDLNSIAYGTSPAYTLQAEHPTGEQYAFYLSELAAAAELRVRSRTEVTAVRPQKTGKGFEVEVVPVGAPGPGHKKKKKNKNKGGQKGATVLRSRYVVWAAGEFQYPRAKRAPLFPGSELCLHNSSVRSWQDLEGDDFVVIGGYESGLDAAYNLASLEKNRVGKG